MQCPRCREGMQYENTTDGLWCPNCGTRVSGYDAALMAGAMREPYPRKKSLADYGWTRPAPQPWVHQVRCAECWEYAQFTQGDEGTYELFPCGHSFIEFIGGSAYMIHMGPPEEAE